jgi:ABC-type nitrate/sulfonate/bicarbonate transport system substrate-binding protein
MIRHDRLTRRQCLATVGPGVATLALGTRRAAAAEPIRQGYQTNLWGMPTYYLLRSGLLERHGIRFEEFAVPSGNLTMQQMVARQVDMGTYAGPSFVLGHARGGLVGIAVIEHVGRTTRIMARRDLNLSKVEQLKGLKVANQTGSSIGNIFVDTIAPAAGLKKGDYQEIRMDVNNMVAALVARTVDAMVNVEPYNAIAEADGIATTIMDYWSIDKMPVLMAATPEFVDRNPDTIVAYLKAWLEVARDFKDSPGIVADGIYAFYTSKGYAIPAETFRKALATIDVNPEFPPDLQPYLQAQAEILLKEKKIPAIPDWSKALRPELMERARTGA